MWEKLLDTPPTVLVAATLLVLALTLSTVIHKKWTGSERRENLFTDKQMEYIDGRADHKARNVLNVITGMKDQLKRIEDKLDHVQEQHDKMELRVAVIEARSR